METGESQYETKGWDSSIFLVGKKWRATSHKQQAHLVHKGTIQRVGRQKLNLNLCAYEIYLITDS